MFLTVLQNLVAIGTMLQTRGPQSLLPYFLVHRASCMLFNACECIGYRLPKSRVIIVALVDPISLGNTDPGLSPVSCPGQHYYSLSVLSSGPLERLACGIISTSSSLALSFF